MATDSTAPPALPADQYAALIERQLGSARRQVKVTDLLSRCMLLVIGVLVFLFLVSLADHWLFDLGYWGRAVAFVALLAGMTGYLLRFILPLAVRSINPVFAARAIERSEPRLKNSLINFLTFRTDTRVNQSSVFQALQHKAATDLATVSIDDAVDRSTTLKLGYALATIVTLFGLYKIFSPKDPFQSISRVAAPWKSIERPTRADIFLIQEHHRATADGPILSSVPPGKRAAYQGHFVTIGAGISGIGNDAPVELQYSSVDGQLVNQTLPMQWNAETQQHEATLPPTSSGIQASLVYSIRAGDVLSTEYLLEVTPTPVITVQSVDYEFPDYTRLPKQTIVGNPHIQAVAGTQITIHAQANQKVDSAVIELFSRDTKTGGSPRAMRCDQDRCEGGFRLVDNHNGELQLSEYGIRFRNLGGERNQEVIRYRIDVLRDLVPEIEILNPKSREIELPEDGTQQIEIRAIDPDYGLRRIQLRAAAGNDSILSHDILEDAAGRTGQVVETYPFTPRKLGLRTGDRIALWALAEDNRVDPKTSTPAPNSRTTPRYYIVITPPVHSTGLPPDHDPQSDTESPEKNSGSKSEKTNNSGDGQGAGDGSDTSAKSEAGSKTPQPSDTEAQATDQEPSDVGSDDTSETGNQEGESSAESNEPGSTTSNASQEDPDSSADSSAPDEGSQNGSGENRTPVDPTASEGVSNAGNMDQKSTGDPPSDPQPASHDGEAIERVLDYLREEAAGDTQPDDSAAEETSSPEDRPATESPSRREATGNGTASSGQADSQQPPNATQAKNAGKDGPARSLESPNESPETSPSPGDNGPGDNTEQAPPATPATGGATDDSPETDNANTPQKPSSNQAKQDENPCPDNATDTSQADAKPATVQSNPSTSPQEKSASENQPSQDATSRTDTPTTDVSKPGQKPDSGESSRTDQSPQTEEQPEKKQGDSEQPNATQNNQTRKGRGADDTSNSSSPEQTSNDSTGSGNQTAPESEQDKKAGDEGAATAGRSSPAKANPRGGGIPSESNDASRSSEAEVRAGDTPDLEHAQKATDLVLEKLAEQESNPDPKLLKKLNWNAEDITEFVRRWKQLKRNAATPTGKYELQQALRSLGLKPQGTRINQRDARKSRISNLNDAGARFAPPPGLRKRFNAYKRSVSRTPSESP
ncbi:MAG: hypothetical protein CMJ75_17910 [Planctomycetaceae bacterium]|nr:hypothetical protein [Planctomycetaceae bacterium]